MEHKTTTYLGNPALNNFNHRGTENTEQHKKP